jgi:predicted anti-sigma-YlaC factor YlaD
MMLSCKEAARLLSQDLDRKLGFGERVTLRVHLAICDGCTNFKSQVAFLRKAVSRLGNDPAKP